MYDTQYLVHSLGQQMIECRLGTENVCWIYLPYNAYIQGIMLEVVRNHHFRFKMVSKFLGLIVPGPLGCT